MAALAMALEAFRRTLPGRPYCTDDPKQGQYRTDPQAALRSRHVQPNTAGLVRWLAFDLDMNGAADRWRDSHAAPPTLIVINRRNGHAHALYGLEQPVPRTDAARAKPLAYLAAVEEGMKRQLGADRGYSGSLVKTPGHPSWLTESYCGLYSLDCLAEWCELPSPADMRRFAANKDYAGLGRNCTLFEHLRKIAYCDVRRFWKPEGGQAFRAHVLTTAEGLNTRFGVPLPHSELKSIARSVSRWVWQRFTPSDFRAIQSGRGAKKGQANRDVLLPVVLRLVGEGRSQREIARLLGLAPMTINSWLRRSELGVRKPYQI